MANIEQEKNSEYEHRIATLTQKLGAVEEENLALKKEVASLQQYIEQLEDFLRDEASVYAETAEEDPVTQIRTFSRGKETAFQYVLDNLKNIKAKKTPPDPGV